MEPDPLASQPRRSPRFLRHSRHSREASSACVSREVLCEVGFGAGRFPWCVSTSRLALGDKWEYSVLVLRGVRPSRAIVSGSQQGAPQAPVAMVLSVSKLSEGLRW